MLRTRFKDGLSDKGLSKAEITKRVEAQDDKGYKNSKGELITENNDLNAWINSQLNNKIKHIKHLSNMIKNMVVDQTSQDYNITLILW